jgi:formyltetrahydrofolate synthetase
MSCALTQNYVLDCKDSQGGLEAVWFIPYNDVTAITEASGVVSAITKAAGKQFYKYQLVKNTASFTENIQGNIENGTINYDQQLVIVINKLQVNMRNEILLLAKNNLMAVIKDKNGKYWLAGRYSGLDLLSGTSGSGTAATDRSGYSLTFSGSEKELAPEVASGVISTLQP